MFGLSQKAGLGLPAPTGVFDAQPSSPLFVAKLVSFFLGCSLETRVPFLFFTDSLSPLPRGGILRSLLPFRGICPFHCMSYQTFFFYHKAPESLLKATTGFFDSLSPFCQFLAPQSTSHLSCGQERYNWRIFFSLGRSQNVFFPRFFRKPWKMSIVSR